MKRYIKFSVYAKSRNLEQEPQRLFARDTEVDTSVVIPYGQIIDTLHFLYGKQAVIEIYMYDYQDHM